MHCGDIDNAHRSSGASNKLFLRVIVVDEAIGVSTPGLLSYHTAGRDETERARAGSLPRGRILGRKDTNFHVE